MKQTILDTHFKLKSSLCTPASSKPTLKRTFPLKDRLANDLIVKKIVKEDTGYGKQVMIAKNNNFEGNKNNIYDSRKTFYDGVIPKFMLNEYSNATLDTEATIGFEGRQEPLETGWSIGFTLPSNNANSKDFEKTKVEEINCLSQKTNNIVKEIIEHDGKTIGGGNEIIVPQEYKRLFRSFQNLENTMQLFEIRGQPCFFVELNKTR